MSATIDEDKFSEYIRDNCTQIVRIPGRTYPIQTFYKEDFETDHLNGTI